MGRVRPMTLFACALALVPASTGVGATTPTCFDAKVYASIVRQTPTNPPKCDSCILISWPWILQLDVKSSIAGRVASGPLTVLSIQHMHFRRDLGVRRWWLRRNSLGAFNLLRGAALKHLPRCAKGFPAAEPYIRPAAGQSLADLEREAREEGGQRP